MHTNFEYEVKFFAMGACFDVGTLVTHLIGMDFIRSNMTIGYKYGTEFKAYNSENIEILKSDYIYNGKEPRDSGLLSRPSLSVAHVICQVYELTYDNDILKKAVYLLFKDYDKLCGSAAYRMDMMDAARQMIGNDAWNVIKNIQQSYYAKDTVVFEENAAKLMLYYDLQDKLTGTDSHALLGKWLNLARAEGETPAEKAYMEFQARTMITLWGDRPLCDISPEYCGPDLVDMAEKVRFPKSFLRRIS